MWKNWLRVWLFTIKTPPVPNAFTIKNTCSPHFFQFIKPQHHGASLPSQSPRSSQTQFHQLGHRVRVGGTPTSTKMDFNPMMFKVKRVLRLLSRPRLKDWFGWFLVLGMFALVLSAVVITFGSGIFGYDPEPVPGPPGKIEPRYLKALNLAMMFFDIQKSGKLENNRIPWRGDSGLKDGSEVNLDLSKGMYDAGDHVKFGFPLAFTATVLSWSILEYGERMEVVSELDSAKVSLKWITDYLVVAHAAKNVLFIQVGDAYLDHKCWDRPENMTDYRPLIQINASKPGTEVAAETAAALASASIVFKKSDPGYSDELLLHAKQLFRFANRYRGSYSDSIPELGSYYKSSGYGDELLWAASWLYHATGDVFYLDYATGDFGEDFANWESASWFCWDDKLAGTHVLLSRVSLLGNHKSYSDGLHNYRKSAEAVMCGLLPSSPTATSSRTPGGLIWINEWNNLQHSIGSAFLAAVYSDYMLTSKTPRLNCNGVLHKPSDLRNFAISQIEYVLGDNPMNMSYIVGYGDNYPGYVHHRGASIPADSLDCTCANGWKWLLSTDRDPNIAYGALVGGPFLNDSYIDYRNNSMQAEPTTYNNAVLIKGDVTPHLILLFPGDCNKSCGPCRKPYFECQSDSVPLISQTTLTNFSIAFSPNVQGVKMDIIEKALACGHSFAILEN